MVHDLHACPAPFDAAAVLSEVSRLLSAHDPEDDPRAFYAEVLSTMLAISGSAYGFICEVVQRADGKRFLKSVAITDIAWDEPTRALLQAAALTGLEFHNLESLFGCVVTSAQPVVANDAPNDPRRGGLPPGHPPLDAFLGVPFVTRGEVIGMCGLANRPGGYDDEVQRQLQPLVSVCVQMLAGLRIARRYRETEHALRKSELQFRQLVENIGDVLWMTSIDKGQMLYVSPSYERIWGRTTAELMREPHAWLDAIHPEDREHVAAQSLDQAVDGNYHVTYRVQRPDGSERWIRDRAFPVRDGAGEVYRIAGIASDITELVESRRIAEASVTARNEFLGIMSHELRTPLNAVSGAAKLLLDGTLDDDQRHLAGVIHSASDALLDVLGGVLDITRIDAGKMVLQARPFELHAMLREIVEMFQYTARERALSLTMRIAEGVPERLLADDVRLRQVLTNLLGNALKFTARGAVRLVVEAAGERLIFRVEDTGPGIAAHEQQRLFERYAQVDPSEGRRIGGVGLGLSISKKLVELMGGEIGVTSALDRGSCFWFTVPRRVPEREEPHAPAAPTTRRRLRVLLVEDVAVNRLIGRRLLELEGCEVELACDGTEAVACTVSGGYDLVLMDCFMPDMDGFEATRAIRVREACEQARRVPIVALTASAMPGDHERCTAVGMDDCILKPIRSSTLRALLDRVASTTG